MLYGVVFTPGVFQDFWNGDSSKKMVVGCHELDVAHLQYFWSNRTNLLNVELEHTLGT